MGEVAVLKTNSLIGPDEIRILRQSLWPTFNDSEVNYAVAICNQLQLNPLLRQIHFVKRNTKNGAAITAQTGIDGFRLTAQRTGQYAGSDDAVIEYGADKKKPVKATVTVYRLMGGQRCPFTASARWEEYVQTIGGQWDKMPHVMLSKCAEALALRKAFPAELSALRSDEEMHQADGPSKAEQVQSRIIPPVVVPKDTSIETTATQVESNETDEDFVEDVPPNCSLCDEQMKKARSGLSWFCPNFSDGKGEHPRVKI